MVPLRTNYTCEDKQAHITTHYLAVDGTAVETSDGNSTCSLIHRLTLDNTAECCHYEPGNELAVMNIPVAGHWHSKKRTCTLDSLLHLIKQLTENITLLHSNNTLDYTYCHQYLCIFSPYCTVQMQDGRGTKNHRNIAKNYNHLSRVHQHYQQTDRRQHI